MISRARLQPLAVAASVSISRAIFKTAVVAARFARRSPTARRPALPAAAPRRVTQVSRAAPACASTPNRTTRTAADAASNAKATSPAKIRNARSPAAGRGPTERRSGPLSTALHRPLRVPERRFCGRHFFSPGRIVSGGERAPPILSGFAAVIDRANAHEHGMQIANRRSAASSSSTFKSFSRSIDGQ